MSTFPPKSNVYLEVIFGLIAKVMGSDGYSDRLLE